MLRMGRLIPILGSAAAFSTARLPSRPLACPRIAVNAPAMSYDYEEFRPDPPWQRDGILLLAYVGVETLLRSSATGVKPKLGFDLMQLNAAMGGAFLIATAWVSVALLTGVVGNHRYDRQRVLLTWLIAAPLAAALRIVLYDGFPFVSELFVLTDAATTLALMLALRAAEEQGII